MLLSPLFVCIAAMLVLPLKSLMALNETEVELGGTVTLACNMSYHHEINWVKLDDEPQLQTLMVLGLKNDGALSVAWNSNESRFEGCVVDRFIGLKIFNVSNSDLATYFCAASTGKRLEFGEGIRLWAKEQQLRPPCDQEPDASSSSNAMLQSHMLVGGALSCGLLVMVLTIAVVHVKTSTWKKRREKGER